MFLQPAEAARYITNFDLLVKLAGGYRWRNSKGKLNERWPTNTRPGGDSSVCHCRRDRLQDRREEIDVATLPNCCQSGYPELALA